MNQPRTNKLVICILGGLTILFGVLILKNFPELPIVSDSEDYHIIATNILTEHAYPAIPNQTLLVYPPFYPLFIAVVYALTHVGEYASVYFLQYLLVGATAIILFSILRTHVKLPLMPSLLASLSILFWPYLVLYSQLISSEVLYTFLLLLFFTLFFSIDKNSRGWITVFAGVILGTTILTRPVALLLFPWILIGLYFVTKLPRVFGIYVLPWKKYCMVFVISIITLLPWTIYAYKQFDRVIPVASNLGNVFTKANKTFEYLPETEKTSVIGAKIKNLYLFWDPGASGYHLDILKEKYPLAGIAVALYKLVFFLIVAFGAVSAVVYRHNRLVLYSVLIIGYTWVLHTALFPFPRYTLPIMPFVIIVAVIGITHFVQYRKHHENTSRNTLS